MTPTLVAQPPLITDANWQDFVRPQVAGERKGHGCLPRDYTRHPQGCFAWTIPYPDSMILPESQWPAALAAQQAQKASLLDLRTLRAPDLDSLDQDSYGLCWAFSTTKAMMYLRARMGLPRLKLSAWWIAGREKDWRDEGGWGAESMGVVAQQGVPEYSLCPEYKSSFDNAGTQANAAQHKCTLWWDGTDNRDTNRAIMVSAFLLGLIPVLDYNWWSHSVCGCRLKSLSPLVVSIDNSWGSAAGANGIYDLQDDKAIPDSVCIPAVVFPTLA